MQGQKEHRMHICQDLLNEYKVAGDSFYVHITTVDEMYCYQYEPESKRQ